MKLELFHQRRQKQPARGQKAYLIYGDSEPPSQAAGENHSYNTGTMLEHVHVQRTCSHSNTHAITDTHSRMLTLTHTRMLTRACSHVHAHTLKRVSDSGFSPSRPSEIT